MLTYQEEVGLEAMLVLEDLLMHLFKLANKNVKEIKIIDKVINHNLHLSRTIDLLKKVNAESEDELHDKISRCGLRIEELEHEPNGYKTLQKLTEDSSDETIISN